MRRIIPFEHFVLFTRGTVFPRVKSRSHLIRLFDGRQMNDAEVEANLLWTEYIEWHCSIDPIERSVSFKTWARALRQFDDEHERAFVQDIDRGFPVVHSPDFIVDYLAGIGAIDEAIAAFERLWIKYKSR